LLHEALDNIMTYETQHVGHYLAGQAEQTKEKRIRNGSNFSDVVSKSARCFQRQHFKSVGKNEDSFPRDICFYDQYRRTTDRNSICGILVVISDSQFASFKCKSTSAK
jgi:hypothetical protein